MSQIIPIPSIYKESSAGIFTREIIDEMYDDRKVYCFGDITNELVQSLILQLTYLEKKDKQKEITLYINSPGGLVNAGLALYDVIQAINCPIKTVCMGEASSMGALLFISGNTREILTHSKVMIHDPLIGNVGGNALTIEKVADNIMKVRELTASIIAKHTNKSIEEILEKTAQDSYFDAQEAIDFGLADKIIERM